MKERVLHFYACEVCEAEYDTATEARACEAAPVPPLVPPPGRLWYAAEDGDVEVTVMGPPYAPRVVNSLGTRGLSPVPGRHVVIACVTAVDPAFEYDLPVHVRLDELKVRP